MEKAASRTKVKYIFTILRLFFFTFIVLTKSLHTQEIEYMYPIWFLKQGNLSCREVAVGYAAASIYPDSAVASAYRDALINHARSKSVSITGSQSFWGTGIGTAWMGSDFAEQYDTTVYIASVSNLKIIESSANQSIVVALIGLKDCTVPDDMRILVNLKSIKQPAWIDNLPIDDKYLYAVGISPEYFYETSSWFEAERMARRNLARSQFVKMKSLQKYAKGENQEVRTEEILVTLKNIEVVERWRDVKEKVFYVLVKISK